MQQALLRFPEVESVVSKIGAAEIATESHGVESSEPIVVLKPRSQWRTARTVEELIAKMRVELEKIPGVAYSFSQPIAHRVDHLVSGVKSQVGVKIFGDDMNLSGPRPKRRWPCSGRCPGSPIFGPNRWPACRISTSRSTGPAGPLRPHRGRSPGRH